MVSDDEEIYKDAGDDGKGDICKEVGHDGKSVVCNDLGDDVDKDNLALRRR